MRIQLLLIVFCSLILNSSFAPLPAKEKITIVIDPGHGGDDPGFLSSNKDHLPEKALNLLIAKKVGAYIEKYLNNVTVVYTRKDDSFPTLDDRVAQANSMSCEYFISIHCNANERKTVHGTESHVHAMTSKKSVALAKLFESEFSGKAGRKSRGVKDGNDREHSLQVLKYTNMTSVLVECGFLTNDKEAIYLNTTNGQDILASAIFRGFRSHITTEHPTIQFIKTEKKTEDKKDVEEEKSTTTESYQIQLSSSKEPIDPNSEAFKKTGLKVTRTKLNTTSAFKYRYTVGPYKDKATAKKDLEIVQKKGFKDAIIITVK